MLHSTNITYGIVIFYLILIYFLINLPTYNLYIDKYRWFWCGYFII